jgi:hypothetical protein
MPISNPAMVALVHPFVRDAGRVVSNEEVHAAAAQAFAPFDARDTEQLVSRAGKSYYQQHWMRTVRRALDVLAATGDIAHAGKGLWKRAAPNPQRMLLPTSFWEAMLARAKDHLQTAKPIPTILGKSLHITHVTDSAIQFTVSGNGTKRSSITPSNVERAVTKINAAGGISSRHTLNNSVAREIAIVELHPALRWREDGEGVEVVLTSDSTGSGTPSNTSIVDVEPPKAGAVVTRTWSGKRPRKSDYALSDARSRDLGCRGERLVVELERQRLLVGGKPELAARVEHVAKTRGDGLGYDVLSFDIDGQEKFIEVKTTDYGLLTPYLITSNEIACSDANPDKFELHRLFNFSQRPQRYVVRGKLRDQLTLEVAAWRPVFSRHS